jgi:8-oxo-dGTP pyrophosphatase MutT (NUDIX family)
VQLDEIRARIQAHDATLAKPETEVTQAAVALILHEPEGSSPEILFIERATREGDPWSGQMALPGGRRDSEDPDLQTTAARETLEEVGVPLRAPLGRLDDFSGNRPRVRRIIVSPYVYELEERPPVRINHEVSSAVWIPVEWILGPESSVEYAFDRAVTDETFPGIRYDRYTVWGLTYRILTNFFDVLGRDLR